MRLSILSNSVPWIKEYKLHTYAHTRNTHTHVRWRKMREAWSGIEEIRPEAFSFRTKSV